MSSQLRNQTSVSKDKLNRLKELEKDLLTGVVRGPADLEKLKIKIREDIKKLEKEIDEHLRS